MEFYDELFDRINVDLDAIRSGYFNGDLDYTDCEDWIDRLRDYARDMIDCMLYFRFIGSGRHAEGIRQLNELVIDVSEDIFNISNMLVED